MTYRVSLPHSIGFQLLRYVFGLYCIATILLTMIHLSTDYEREKQTIFSEFILHQQALYPTLANAVWHLDIPQIHNTLEGVVTFPMIVGASVHTAKGELLTRVGMVPREEAILPRFALNNLEPAITDAPHYSEGLFQHRFELTQTDYGTEEHLGSVYLYSHPQVLYPHLYQLFSV